MYGRATITLRSLGDSATHCPSVPSIDHSVLSLSLSLSLSLLNHSLLYPLNPLIPLNHVSLAKVKSSPGLRAMHVRLKEALITSARSGVRWSGELREDAM